MTFLSLAVLLWLTGAAVATWVVPRRFSQYAAALVCAAFMALNAPLSLALLTCSALISYFAPGRRGRPVVILAVVGLLAALLVWFKLEKTYGVSGVGELFNHAVPLGISYYAFRQIHYLFERFKRKLPEHHLGDYLAYLFFLPTLMVGPINLFGDFKRDLARRRFDTAALSGGLERVLYGYAKIIVLGNYLVSYVLARQIFELREAQPALAEYLDCVRHGANLYFQFAGYSDVAIGFSLIMGFRVIENFNYPFVARNINEFWNRWHISLSAWCRAYVFTPVASATRAPYIAIVASMLVLALWHEISLRYVIWGLYHGLGIAGWQLWQRLKRSLPPIENQLIKQVVGLASVLLTLNFVVLSFVVTKEDSLAAAWRAIGRLLGVEV